MKEEKNYKKIQADHFTEYYSTTQELDKDYTHNSIELYYWKKFAEISRDALSNKQGSS